MTIETENHAEQQAAAQYESIVRLITAVECDYDRLRELFRIFTLEDEKQRNQDAQDLEHLKQFFYDCFERLAGHYPCPEFSSDYDKSVIFAAIERGEACEANHEEGEQ